MQATFIEWALDYTGACLDKEKRMAFMQQQITRKMWWVEIDGTCGITAVALDDLTKDQRAIADSVSGDPDAEPDDLQAHFGDYYEGEVQSISTREGFGARMSAPGYLDCTEWAVFDSEKEAEVYLGEMLRR